MSHRLPVRTAVAVAGVALLALTACGTEESPTTVPPAAARSTAAWRTFRCATPGTLTIGTDSPAFPPYSWTTTRPTARASSPRSPTPWPRRWASPRTT